MNNNVHNTAEAVDSAGFLVYRRSRCSASSPSGVVEFLLLQEPPPRVDWGPPKGHVEPHEAGDPMSTAVRETAEECGLVAAEHLRIIRDFRRLVTFTVRRRDNSCSFRKSVLLWLAELTHVDATIQLSDEHVDYRWVTTEDVAAMEVFDEYRELIH